MSLQSAIPLIFHVLLLLQTFRNSMYRTHSYDRLRKKYGSYVACVASVSVGFSALWLREGWRKHYRPIQFCSRSTFSEENPAETLATEAVMQSTNPAGLRPRAFYHLSLTPENSTAQSTENVNFQRRCNEIFRQPNAMITPLLLVRFRALFEQFSRVWMGLTDD